MAKYNSFSFGLLKEKLPHKARIEEAAGKLVAASVYRLLVF